MGQGQVADPTKINKETLAMVGTLSEEFRISDNVRMMPEFPLLMEVFHVALGDAINFPAKYKEWGKLNQETKDGYLEGIAWVIEDLPDHLYSLEGICNFLGLSHEAIRRALLSNMKMTIQDIIEVLLDEGWEVNGY